MTSLLRILRFAPQLHRLYLGIAVSSVLAAVLALATPFLIGAATDRIVAAVAGETGVAEAVTAVTWLAVAFLAVEVATTLVVSVGGYWGDVMAARMRTILSTRYFEQLLHLPQRYFDTAITGRVVNRLNRTINEITQFLQFFANNAFTMLVTTAAVGLVVMALLPVPAGAAFALGAVVAPPDAVAATAIARRVGLPKRLVTVLQGESLVNDATALVALRSALGVLAAEPVYLLFDLAVVGRLGAVALAGLAIGGLILALVSSQLTFLSYGTTARAARSRMRGCRAASICCPWMGPKGRNRTAALISAAACACRKAAMISAAGSGRPAQARPMATGRATGACGRPVSAAMLAAKAAPCSAVSSSRWLLMQAARARSFCAL